MPFSLYLRVALVAAALACAAPCHAASAGSARPEGLADADWHSLEGAIAKATEEARLAIGSEAGADGVAGDYFGWSVAVSGDTALVGVYYDDIGATDDQGSAYVFVRSGTGWSLQAKLVAADGGEYQYFGQSVALEGDTALIGTDGTPGAAYVFARSGTSWSQQAKLTPSDGVDTDSFGSSVAISGDTAIVGAPLDDVGAEANQGSAYVFTRTGASWSEQAHLIAGNGSASDQFGRAVAISGESAVVGAPNDQSSTGTAYVFVRSGSTWSEQAELDRVDESSSDSFGFSIAMSGETVAVGVISDDVGVASAQGTVRVYVRSGTIWTEQATLTASDGAASHRFGVAVALVGDTVVVGAKFANASYVFTRSGSAWSEQARIAAGECPGESVALSGDTAVIGDGCTDVGGNNLQGAARVYVRSGTTWSFEAQLDQGNGSGEQELGVAVALSGDTALVGAHYDGASAYQQGAAFVFVRSGAAWTLQARLLASDALERDSFGAAVALSGDTALIGANRADVGANPDQGAAYVFVRSGATWAEQAKLVAADGTSSAAFGDAVALEGNTALVGAPGATVGATPGQGAAYAFVRSGGTWGEQQKLAASDGAASSGFGTSVALSGESALVGAPGATVAANAMQGAAYVFLRSVATWTEQARLVAADGAPSDGFGSAVALSGDTALAGASNDDVDANADQGSAYAFVRSGASWSEQMRLVASDGAAGDRLGVAVALAGDTALVGNSGLAPQNGAAHVFVRSGTSWTPQPKLVASDGSPGDRFGEAVALSGGTALVGAPGDDTTGSFGNFQEGAAYVFALGGGTAFVEIRADGPDPSAEGQPVTVEVGVSGDAAPTVDGYVAVMASSGESCIAPMPAVGGGTTTTWSCDIVFASSGVRTLRASYIGSTAYPTTSSSAETHAVDPAGRELLLGGESPLIAPDGAAGDLGGASVAASDDFVVMGAPNADGDGAVYVFKRVTDAAAPPSAKSIAGLVAAKDLVPVATLANTAGALGDKWGAAVAISPDGATIAIGAPGAGGGAGTAAVFTRPGSDWSDDDTPTATLVPPASVTGDKFGTAVAIDGGMVAVGAPGTASLGMAGAGAAHVFDGTTRIATLEPDPQSADVDTAFGASLALSGGRLVVGAPNENIGGRPDGGAVRLYEVDASSVGAPTLLVPPGTDFNKWGASVAIDGRTVVGGAPGAGGANGAAFVFQAADGGMVLRARLDGGPDSAGAGMGGSIAVSGDYILVGAPLADVGGRADQGRAFVFLQPEGGWRDAAANGSLVAADGAAGDGYGSAVSLSRRGAAIGIPKRDLGSEADQGQADSFILDRIFRGAFE